MATIAKPTIAKPTKTPARTTGKTTAKTTKTRGSSLFSQEERDAMREYVDEKKAGKGAKKEDGAAQVQAAIAKMADADRRLAERVHTIVMAAVPELEPKTWYGMPAYAKDGQTICFFQNAGKFKARYSTLGFSDKARLDDGNMWPASFALLKLSAADEKRIAELVKTAVG
ncbi:MAG TPA: DUF1801 domain-containing protein [Devosia sp.]|nr:DUF1801 domain-containing protein [Devosia sp.]